MQLSQFKALSFDCYGTLIDWEAGLSRALEPLRSQVGVSQDELLEAFGNVEHEVEEERPGARYSELLTIVHARLAQRVGVPVDEDAARNFGQSVGDWPAFPDSATALRYLKRHFELIILSNVDRASFARSNERLGVEFDRVFTAEEIGSYKPDLRNFEYLLARLGENGLEKADLLHVAQSLFHDHAPANRFGIASAWIDRRHDKHGGGATKVPEPMPHFDFRFASLEELAAAHRAELAEARLDASS
jgi:2-haloacid dehalogenase